MSCPAIKHISTTVSRFISRNSFSIRKTEHTDNQRTFAVILRECGRSILRMSIIYIIVGCLETIRSAQSRLLYTCILWQFRKPAKHIHHIRIRESALHCKQLTQVFHRRRYGVKEMFLTLEIAAETISSQNLKRTEKHKQSEPFYKMTY